MSDKTGMSMDIALFVPASCDALTEGAKEAYATYHLEVRKLGFRTQRIEGIQVFANIHSTISIPMIPCEQNLFHEDYVSIIPVHQLQTSQSECRASSPSMELQGGKTIMLREVIIPTNITVHLGRPTSNAENLTVPFIYYLKNVASSEVYPTWPYEALKANIWAQISLVLNRVFTEWYPSQGYNFDITNSTAYDQAFVKNRNIYDNISAIVDEVFNEYLQKRNFQEPFYAEYCDGKIAQCPGMKQWGTLDLANRGYDALRILRYYYGDQVRIISSDNIQAIQSSYPGTPLRLGDRGPVVSQLQAQLNGIAINYPNIKPIFPVNGIFTPTMEAAVRVFQRQFNLTVDGIVGRATYYKISFVYVAVRKLAELGSLGHLANLYSGEWQGSVLRVGNRGVETQLMQYYLSSISLFYPEIPTVSIDGRFGSTTENAVLAFQRRFGLTADGLVGQATWERIYEIYTSIENQIPNTNTPPYPGTPLQLGSVGDSVLALQNALITINKQYPSIPLVVADGIFGSRTEDAVREYQSLFNLGVDGIVGPSTWDSIFKTAQQIENGSNSSSTSITDLQNQLQSVASVYPAMPSVSLTNTYDEQTRNAIKAFQRMMGLPVHGESDELTQDVLSQISEEL
ncbi:MAG: peptidoglycan-binding protein [Longicatena sp.]